MITEEDVRNALQKDGWGDQKIDAYCKQLAAIRDILKASRCPNKGCNNEGVITLDVYTGYIEQCQWCYEKKAAIEEYENE